MILDHIPWQRDNKMYYVTANIPEINCDQINDMCELVVRQFDSESQSISTDIRSYTNNFLLGMYLPV